MKYLMKKISIATLATTLAILLFAGCFFARGKYGVLLDSELSHLDPKTKMQVMDIDQTLKVFNAPDRAYDALSFYDGQVPTEYVQMWIDEGYFGDYIDAIRGLGYSVSTPSTSSSATENISQSTPEPEAFTVEAYEPAKTMWATSEVNCRSGASTSYSKVGSLKQYDEVIVTGVASTGWYEITKEDGSKVYVSNKYLTEDDPSNRTVYDYDAETNTMNSYTFTDTDPEVIDEIVEQIKAEEETEENTEPIIEEKPTVVALEVAEEETTETEIEVEAPEQVSFLDTLLENPPIIFGIVVCLVMGGFLTVVFIKRRK